MSNCLKTGRKLRAELQGLQSHESQYYFGLIQELRAEKRFANISSPFTPWELIRKMFSELSMGLNDSVCVLFTVEFAIELHFRGFKNVTLVSDVHCPAMKFFADHLGYEYTTLDTIMTKKSKFDYAVGNPPYVDPNRGNDNVWPEHTANVLDLADNVAWIIPASVGMSDFRGNKLAREKLHEHGLKKFQFLPWNTFGKEATVIPCYVISQRGYRGDISVCDLAGNVYKPRDGYYVSHGIVNSILDKLPTNDQYVFKKITNKNIHDKQVPGTVKCDRIVTKITNKAVIETEDKVCYQKDADKYRVITSFQNNGPTCANYYGDMLHLKAVNVLEPGVALKNNYMYLTCDSRAEAEIIVSYLQTNLCNIIWAYTRTSRSIDKPQIRWIPKYTGSSKVTDDDLIQMFNLTAEEADFVRNFYSAE